MNNTSEEQRIMNQRRPLVSLTNLVARSAAIIGALAAYPPPPPDFCPFRNAGVAS